MHGNTLKMIASLNTDMHETTNPVIEGPVEEHRGLGGNTISRLYNGSFIGLIYSLLVFS